MAVRKRAQIEAQAPAPVGKPRTSQAPTPLLHLQRLAGNAAVSSLIAQRQEENLPTQSGGGGGGGGGGMVNMFSMSKRGQINVSIQNGAVIDASASVG
jgi:hypothetical protein